MSRMRAGYRYLTPAIMFISKYPIVTVVLAVDMDLREVILQTKVIK